MDIEDFRSVDSEKDDLKEALEALRQWDVDREKMEQYRELYHGTTTIFCTIFCLKVSRVQNRQIRKTKKERLT